MDNHEAKTVLEILATADGGCEFCARELFNRFAERFPEFSELAESIFREKFGKELNKEASGGLA
jgi:hypothetical protein